MGQVTPQETVHASEFLSDHTIVTINLVDFFLGLLSLGYVQGGVFPHLCICLCDGVLPQLFHFLSPVLRVQFSSAYISTHPPIYM